MMDCRQFDFHIFDLDDTLINTRHSYKKAQEIAVRKTFPEVSPNQINQTLPVLRWICRQFGSGNVLGYMRAFLQSETEFLPQRKDNLDKLINFYQSSFNSELVCFEGASEYIQNLKSAGLKIALVSNGYWESQLAKLNHVGLDSFFVENLIYISENFPPLLKKPDPHMIREACKEADVSHEKSIFYGNSSDDILAGNLAGVTTAHFYGSTRLPEETPAIAKPDFIFEKWSDLNAAFGSERSV